MPSIGGLQNVVAAWAEQLSIAGCEIVIITETISKTTDNYPFKVIRHASFLKKVTEMSKSDVVVMFNVSIKALPHWLLSGTPLVINHQTALFYPGKRGPWQQRLKQWVGNHLSSLNISCSNYIANTYQHSEVVENPYDDKLFVDYKLERPKCFLFTGRLVSDKGCDLLITAFTMLTKKISGEYKLTIIGDGPDRKGLEKQARESGLEHRVDFVGILTGECLVQEMNRHKVMIVPSRMEPFGIVALEGLACGCNMILSDTGGLPQAAGGMARLFASESAEALMEAMIAELNNEKKVSNYKLPIHLLQHTKEATAQKFFKIINKKLTPH